MHFWFMSENKKRRRQKKIIQYLRAGMREKESFQIAIQKSSWGNLDDKKKRRKQTLKVKWNAQQEITF